MSRRFTIARIHNTILRRAVLLVAFVPILVIGSAIYGLREAWNVVVEAVGSFRAAWGGEP